MRTAADIEMELITNIHLTPVQVNDLKDERLEMEELEDEAAIGRATREALELDPFDDPGDVIKGVYNEVNELERENTDLAAERDAADGRLYDLRSRMDRLIYETVSNEGERGALIDALWEDA